MPYDRHNFTLDTARAAEMIMRIRPKLVVLGRSVMIKSDDIAAVVEAARAVGADRVELHTESYARAHATAHEAEVLAGFVASAEAALRCGLG